jgi:DNA polymerase-3 subunit epsilon
MRKHITFWIFVVVCTAFTLFVIFSLSILFWQQLTLVEKQFMLEMIKRNLAYHFSALVLLLAGLGFAVDWLFRMYILPMEQLSEDMTIIHSANPSHRAQLEGGPDVVRLSRAINRTAERIEELQHHVRKRVEEAKAKVEEEKDILAAVVSELPDGVMICNNDGQILLYNQRARWMLGGQTIRSDESSKEPPSDRFIGLGRSIFGVIDKHLIVHALDEISRKLKADDPNVVSYFVAVGGDDRLLRTETVPILDHTNDMKGFILLLSDYTRQYADDTRLNFQMQTITRQTRAAVASIRAAIEAMIDYPSMGAEMREQLQQIIHKESLSLGKIIDGATTESRRLIQSRWPLVQMRAKDLLEATVRKSRQRLGLEVIVETCEEQPWLEVDSYALISALVYMHQQIQSETGVDRMGASLFKDGRFVFINFSWTGKPIRMDMLKQWEERSIVVQDEFLPVTFREVIEQHRAEMWSCAAENGKGSCLRLLLPVVETIEHPKNRQLTILPRSRPEFFDFNLFNQPGQRPELDNRSLTELTFTVFDTETTGLDPSGGDEIISIGAIRIVNGRLLKHENFDQLIDPRIPLPPESIEIHGIQPEMLEGQPTIDQVLPAFQSFSRDTILVAHNAAFDMRMLQIKEDATGVKFYNPVLDTLLLSAFVHPVHKDHDLEDIARRLGVNIMGRHTALGDAIATGEVFLKLIPLLRNMGIFTLKEAREASRKTYYSRLRY